MNGAPAVAGIARAFLSSAGRAAILLQVLIAAGCATAPHPRIPPERLLDGAAVFGTGAAPADLPDADILRVTQEMRDYLRAFAGDEARQALAVDHIVRALFDPAGLHMEYDPNKTLTAAETFAQRRGNCLAYSNLLVALAREMGLHAEFREVEIPPSWDEATNDLYVYDQHVNVGISRGSIRLVFDVNAPGGMAEMLKLPAQVVTDERAFAQYYSNVGVSHLIAGNLVEAFRYFRKALVTDPEFHPVWVNLGILFRRAGKPDFAEAAYQQVLQAAPHDYLALSNLAHLYESTGATERAAEVAKQVEQERLRNPYYRYHLALAAFEERDYEGARKQLLAALRELRDEPRLHLFLGAVNLQLEHPDRAAANFRDAEKLAESEDERVRMGNKAKKLKELAERSYRSD